MNDESIYQAAGCRKKTAQNVEIFPLESDFGERSAGDQSIHLSDALKHLPLVYLPHTRQLVRIKPPNFGASDILSAAVINGLKDGCPCILDMKQNQSTCAVCQHVSSKIENQFILDSAEQQLCKINGIDLNSDALQYKSNIENIDSETEDNNDTFAVIQSDGLVHGDIQPSVPIDSSVQSSITLDTSISSLSSASSFGAAFDVFSSEVVGADDVDASELGQTIEDEIVVSSGSSSSGVSSDCSSFNQAGCQYPPMHRVGQSRWSPFTRLFTRY